MRVKKHLLFNLFILLVFVSYTNFVKAGSIDPGFLPVLTVSGRAYAVARQPDGKLIVAGLFTSANSTLVNNISRLNADGSVDTSFNSGLGANAPIYSLLIQPDGKVIAGGEFTKFNEQVRNHLVRLNPDGSVDSTFNASTGVVHSLALQSDSRILVGGNFNLLIIRLNSNGSLDNTFTSNTSGFGGTVSAIVVQADQKILVGGGFSQFSNSTSSNLVRLNPNGSVDASFDIGNGTNNGISDIVIQSDGKIIIGGSFTLFRSSTAWFIARLNPDGSRDTSYPNGDLATGFNNSITSLKLQPDGKVIVGGFFAVFNFNSRNRILRLNQDGTLDTTFNPNNGFDNSVSDLVIYDSKIIAVGSFASFDSFPRFGIAQLDSIGGIDSDFTPGVGLPTEAYVIKSLPSGKVIVGGNFDMVNGASRTKIARLNADGTLDNSFAPPIIFTGPVRTIDIQPDGKILLGAVGIRVNNVPKYVIRLNADGSLDPTFNSNIPADSITKVKTLNDGKILVAGNFESVGGILRKNFARLNSDGSADSSFVTGTGFSSAVLDFEVQSDGKIIVCGVFITFNGVTRPSIGRLNSDGSLDQSFNVGSSPTSAIYDAFIQPDGKILLGGGFNTINGVSRNAIARVNPDATLDTSFTSPFISSGVSAITIRPNGKILVGGILRIDNSGFSKALVQLNENGSVNNSINPNITGSVYSIENLFDGRIMIAGRMDTPARIPLDEAFNISVARIIPQAVKNDFDHDGKADISVFRPLTGTWYLQQSTNGFTGATFGQDGDKIAPADYDGDSKIDIAVFRNGVWYILRSSLGFTAVTFGERSDIPQPADYDGDGKADVAVFRPSNGTWYLLQSTAGFTGVAFGQAGDKPVAADYDGDGKTDVAVFRAGTWYIQRSQLGFTGIAFGESTDKPVVGDYDGDGKADVAVFRPSNGVWYLLRSQLGFTGITFGLGTDVPVPADYDGDGKTDVAVFREGTWYLNRSTAGFTGVAFGTATDKPVPNAFIL